MHIIKNIEIVPIPRYVLKINKRNILICSETNKTIVVNIENEKIKRLNNMPMINNPQRKSDFKFCFTDDTEKFSIYDMKLKFVENFERIIGLNYINFK